MTAPVCLYGQVADEKNAGNEADDIGAEGIQHPDKATLFLQQQGEGDAFGKEDGRLDEKQHDDPVAAGEGEAVDLNIQPKLCHKVDGEKHDPAPLLPEAEDEPEDKSFSQHGQGDPQECQQWLPPPALAKSKGLGAVI